MNWSICCDRNRFFFKEIIYLKLKHPDLQAKYSNRHTYQLTRYASISRKEKDHQQGLLIENWPKTDFTTLLLSFIYVRRFPLIMKGSITTGLNLEPKQSPIRLTSLGWLKFFMATLSRNIVSNVFSSNSWPAARCT